MNITELEKSPINSESNSDKTEKTIEPVEGLPFAIVKIHNKYVVVFGQHMISELKFTSSEAAKKWLAKTDWGTIIQVIGIYVNAVIEHNAKTKKP